VKLLGGRKRGAELTEEGEKMSLKDGQFYSNEKESSLKAVVENVRHWRVLAIAPPRGNKRNLREGSKDLGQ